jgi:hypothetical protein
VKVSTYSGHQQQHEPPVCQHHQDLADNVSERLSRRPLFCGYRFAERQDGLHQHEGARGCGNPEYVAKLGAISDLGGHHRTDQTAGVDHHVVEAEPDRSSAAFLGCPGDGARYRGFDDRAADGDEPEGDADDSEVGGGSEQEIPPGEGRERDREGRLVAEAVGERTREHGQEIEGAGEEAVDDAVGVRRDAKAIDDVNAEHHHHAVIGEALEELHHDRGVERSGKLTQKLEIHGGEVYLNFGSSMLVIRDSIRPPALPRKGEKAPRRRGEGVWSPFLLFSFSGWGPSTR